MQAAYSPMVQMTIQIPGHLKVTPFDVQMMLAAKLYEDGKLTAGQAAETVGITKAEFIEKLGNYGVSAFGYDFEELENDLQNF